ncbi:MAG: bifunctional (p)ppGpp synthetase/guanosine-3',5'-bis(diphosphate) 3'-pyrophosphohydrolase [Anaerolineae bacterium]|nr:bifunctional (p)ppGpp synthetase/guanosine-3',5'-bis(diphosphate) 3'-pyrophosphohydrolase [Anaerolineae bacterium]
MAEKIQQLLAQVLKAAPVEAHPLLRRAYEFAAAAHEGQYRLSGEPYILHCLETARLLTELKMDPDTIAAALLHDILEDTPVTLEELTQEFGPAVAFLVHGVTMLEEIADRVGRPESDDEARVQDLAGSPEEQDDEGWQSERDLQSWRKMFLAMSKDVRVMLIKLADRMHNMRTIEYLPVQRQRRLARETIETHAPLADWLGIWRWKSELEDLSFHTLDPDTYCDIAAKLAERKIEGERRTRHHAAIIHHHLWLEGVEAEIFWRPKHIYSIYRKMQRKHIPLERVCDVRAIRVIVDSVAECYQVLGIVHNIWQPVPGEFDDYIATPKENMYQSLHTAVFGEDGRMLEVQIRTQYMHNLAEYGVASHWRYKDGSRYDHKYNRYIAALRTRIKSSSIDDSPQALVDELSEDLWPDRVYVSTPKGKVLDLPAGSTPIDFAYYVHTEIGHRCRGAKVHGRWVPLLYTLQNGDQVEIITAKRDSPSMDWLNPDLGYVKTARARAKIRQWFRQQRREQNIALGRLILERALKRLGLARMAHEAVAELFGYDKLDDFLAKIGFGDIHSGQITSRVTEAQRQQESAELTDVPATPVPTDLPQQIQVLGTDGFYTRLGQCCHPILGDPIIGYITRGRGITIHRRDCTNVVNVRDPERLISVSWGPKLRTFPIVLHVLVHDRPGLLHEITGVLSREGINIDGLVQKKDQKLVTLYLNFSVTNSGQLARLLARIGDIPNVLEVRRQT